MFWLLVVKLLTRNSSPSGVPSAANSRANTPSPEPSPEGGLLRETVIATKRPSFSAAIPSMNWSPVACWLTSCSPPTRAPAAL